MATFGAFGAASADPWSACADAADRAERAAGLPPGLLLAIGRVESGRVHPDSGRVVPWPYAINAGGVGHLAPDAPAALLHVSGALARGQRLIDVGCFQINLHHHPQAFARLEDAFDPDLNAAYAARFLLSLRDAAGSWAAAAGRYHSGTPAFAEPYAARVLAAWSGGAPSLRAAAPASVVRVYTPSGPASGALSWSPGRLPQVFTRHAQ